MTKYCSNCGRELPDEAIYCPDCGKKFVPRTKADFPENNEVDSSDYEFNGPFGPSSKKFEGPFGPQIGDPMIQIHHQLMIQNHLVMILMVLPRVLPLFQITIQQINPLQIS